MSHEAVMIAFKQNIEKLQKVLFRLIEKVPVDERACQCADALKSARG